jgi:hypothetical protein
MDGSGRGAALDIGLMPDGTFAASVTSVDLGLVGELPANLVRYSAPKVFIQWKSFGAVFDGNLEKGKLIGKVHLGPRSFPAVLERPRNEAATRQDQR